MIQTALELDFADGTYLFDLKLPQLAELQEKRKAGVFAIYGRVMRGRTVIDGTPFAFAEEGQSFAEDLFEVIRLGLIGGGKGVVDGREISVNAVTARTLVERYCHSAPLRDSWNIAAAILLARVEGYDPPKAEPPKAAAPDTTTQSTSGTPSPPAP